MGGWWRLLVRTVLDERDCCLTKVGRVLTLKPRTISRSDSAREVVRGFFQDVLDRIELEPVREALGAALEARIPQA